MAAAAAAAAAVDLEPGHPAQTRVLVQQEQQLQAVSVEAEEE